MVWSAAWKKHARVGFSKSKTITLYILHESKGRVQFEVFEKLTIEFFSNARETILLLINNIHENICISKFKVASMTHMQDKLFTHPKAPFTLRSIFGTVPKIKRSVNGA
jgi:hypothetical protein